MALSESQTSRVPLTLRDPFFQDPFFKNAWDDFERVREEMMRETRAFWTRVEEDMKRMSDSTANSLTNNSSTSMSSSNVATSSSSNTSNSALDSTKKSIGGTELSLPLGGGGGDWSPWMFPRRWMMPSFFGSGDSSHSDRLRSLDLFQHKDDQVIRLKDDDSKFELSLDTHGYRPDEIRINIKDKLISIEGKHEERTDNRSESRHFNRSYTLPENCEAHSVHSNLSSDGILVITAPKKQKQSITDQGRAVPIEMKK